MNKFNIGSLVVTFNFYLHADIVWCIAVQTLFHTNAPCQAACRLPAGSGLYLRCYAGHLKAQDPGCKLVGTLALLYIGLS